MTGKVHAILRNNVENYILKLLSRGDEISTVKALFIQKSISVVEEIALEELKSLKPGQNEITGRDYCIERTVDVESPITGNIYEKKFELVKKMTKDKRIYEMRLTYDYDIEGTQNAEEWEYRSFFCIVPHDDGNHYYVFAEYQEKIRRDAHNWNKQNVANQVTNQKIKNTATVLNNLLANARMRELYLEQETRE